MDPPKKTDLKPGNDFLLRELISLISMGNLTITMDPHNGPCVFRIAWFIGRQKNVALKAPWVGDSDSNPCDSIHLLFQPPVFFNSWWVSFSNQDLLLSFIPTPKKVECQLTTSYCHWFLAFWCPCRGDKHTMTALWRLSNQRHFQETPAAPPRL